MEACYEYLGCRKVNCTIYGKNDNRHCWEVENTLCNHIGIQITREWLSGIKKEIACIESECIYYKVTKKHQVSIPAVE